MLTWIGYAQTAVHLPSSSQTVMGTNKPQGRKVLPWEKTTFLWLAQKYLTTALFHQALAWYKVVIPAAENYAVVYIRRVLALLAFLPTPSFNPKLSCWSRTGESALCSTFLSSGLSPFFLPSLVQVTEMTIFEIHDEVLQVLVPGDMWTCEHLSEGKLQRKTWMCLKGLETGG